MTTEHWVPNRSITFNRWEDCGRCGLPWKRKLLVMQRGVKVCPECFDDPCHEDNVARGELREPEGLQSAPWELDVQED